MFFCHILWREHAEHRQSCLSRDHSGISSSCKVPASSGTWKLMWNNVLFLELKMFEIFYALANCELFHVRSFVVRKLCMLKRNIEFCSFSWYIVSSCLGIVLSVLRGFDYPFWLEKQFEGSWILKLFGIKRICISSVFQNLFASWQMQFNLNFLWLYETSSLLFWLEYL